MPRHNLDLISAMRRIADKRIEEAIAQGKFDNLRGRGKDLILDDMPADENARMTWWCLRILRNNDVIPHEVQWRKQIDYLKAMLAKEADNSRRRTLTRQVNELIHKINTLGTNALHAPLTPLPLDTD
ncbi:MAG TPA: DUF1992 domain-containing protein [Tepidisphaeraceae bacterium]|nr:DUF1992 domain-containing protein [Tepidisphaeraceae bacterium]